VLNHRRRRFLNWGEGVGVSESKNFFFLRRWDVGRAHGVVGKGAG